MSVTLANVGGTTTGGASIALTSGGNSTGKRAVFYTPSHTRLAPREVDFLVEAAKTSNTDPGVARAGVRIYFANRDVQEGCCTVQSGGVTLEVSARWSLNQPDSVVADALDYLRSAVFSQQFEDAIIKGILPE